MAMAATVSQRRGATRFEHRAATRDPAWIKVLVLALSLGFFFVFLLLPLIAVFVEALRKGWTVYLASLTEPDAVSAIKLTLLTAAIAVPLNLAFGIAAA